MTDAAAATPATLRRLAAMREYAEAGQEADPDDVLSLLDTLAARDAEVTRLRAALDEAQSALEDVVDTDGSWEHFDGHCTLETECCSGHVARVLRMLWACGCGHARDRHKADTCMTCDGMDGPYTGSCNGYRAALAPAPGDAT